MRRRIRVGATDYLLPEDTDVAALVESIAAAMQSGEVLSVSVSAGEAESRLTLLLNGSVLESVLVETDDQPGKGWITG
jgi:DNA-binding NarL/FixJ family response regulator